MEALLCLEGTRNVSFLLKDCLLFLEKLSILGSSEHCGRYPIYGGQVEDFVHLDLSAPSIYE